MPELRAAIVGAGLMGRWHADAIARAGGRVVAVVDTRIEQARKLAGDGEGFRSLDDLGSRMSLDVVHICTPLATHVELAEQALALGANVVVEKPLAADAESTAALLGRSDGAAAAGRPGTPVRVSARCAASAVRS